MKKLLCIVSLLLLGITYTARTEFPPLLSGNKNEWIYIAEDSPEGLFIQAVEKADISTMRYFIQKRLSVEITHGRIEMFHMGYPLLSYAIKSQSLEAVKLLINAKANVNRMVEHSIINKKANMRNMPLLSYAISLHSSLAIIQALIDAGADVNRKGVVGDWTPLMIASYYGYLQAVKLLLGAGADPLIENKYDQNRIALDYAKEKNNLEIIALLK